MTSNLSVALYGKDGERVGGGVKVKLHGPDGTQDVETGPHGEIYLPLPEGEYELEVEGEKFLAQTLRDVDLKHEGGHGYEFQLEHGESDDDLDYDEIERGRMDRLPRGHEELE